MPIEFHRLTLPPTASVSKLVNFGREVRGFDPGTRWTEEEFRVIEEGLYKYDILVFRDCELPPEQQLALTQAFDPSQSHYGHDHLAPSATRSIILHPGVKHVPHVPQVQIIGNGVIPPQHLYVDAVEGGEGVRINHPTHWTFHKSRISENDCFPESNEDGEGTKMRRKTRFMRWHIDAALYDFSPPKVTTLYCLIPPIGPNQIVRYDDGSNDELEVPIASTVFISGKTMFEGLKRELKSLAVRGRVKYAPHPYVWMSTARAMSTGLGIESEGRELKLEGGEGEQGVLPKWEQGKIKILPFLWKNPFTGELAMQVHPCAALEIIIDPLPPTTSRENRNVLYPDGAHIKDLNQVRDLLYKMQRPAIAPPLIYAHDWSPRDLVLFHNRGVMHSVTGSLRPDELRIFHQCNLAASGDPDGPSEEDVAEWA